MSSRSKGLDYPSGQQDLDDSRSSEEHQDTSVYYVTRSESLGTSSAGGPTDNASRDGGQGTEVQHAGTSGQSNGTKNHGSGEILDPTVPGPVEAENAAPLGQRLDVSSQGEEEAGIAGASGLVTRIGAGASVGDEPHVGSHCLADLRRDVAFIRQDMLRVDPTEWLNARNEFHVRLADVETLIQEDAFPHIEELIAAGRTVRVDSAKRELEKLQDFLTETLLTERLLRKCHP